MPANFREVLRSNRTLFFDGGMGTQLAERGAEPGTAANFNAPEIVMAVHRAYREAGAEVLTTNTFGVNRQVLGRREDSDRMPEHKLAEACGIACDLARKSLGGDGFIAGDIGPMGVLLEPYGTMQEGVMRSVFSVTARFLAKGGVDLFLVETMTDSREMTLAVQACREAAPGIPVAATMSFDPSLQGGFRTNMGICSSTPSDFEKGPGGKVRMRKVGPPTIQRPAEPSSALTAMLDAGADIVGANCGAITPEQMAEVVREFRSVTDRPILAQPNAGLPELRAGQAVFGLSPEAFAAGMMQVIAAGARLVGGCCGTTPAHIAALVREAKMKFPDVQS